MKDFIHFIKEYNISNLSTSNLIQGVEGFADVFDHIGEIDPELYHNAIKSFHEKVHGEHFNEYFAKKQVDDMHHTDIHKTIVKGEFFSPIYAKQIYDNRVRLICPTSNVWDVYVALNSQYHDYVKIFTEKMPSSDEHEIKNAVVETAIVFWFKDEDAKPNKVWNYFK